MKTLLALVALTAWAGAAACSKTNDDALDGGTDASGGGGAGGMTPPGGGGLCAGPADCRAFDDYCGGCTCLALAKSEPDPVCKGTLVSCDVAPCQGRAVVCVNSHCIAGPFVAP